MLLLFVVLSMYIVLLVKHAVLDTTGLYGLSVKDNKLVDSVLIVS